MSRPLVQGYLPHDRPAVPAMISLGLQHVITMFPATVLVALLTGFDVGVTLFASGLATLIALLLSRGQIPLYYGSSFAYIVPVTAIVKLYGVPVAQAGIVATAFVSLVAGLVIRQVGRAVLDRILPPIVTGSMAIVIGIALAKAALDQATGACCLQDQLVAQGGTWFAVALSTLLITVCASVYLQGRGLLGMLPILIGALGGYVVALGFGLVDFSNVGAAAWLSVPRFSLPDFTHPQALTAMLAIAPIAVATIPESTAHLYQISLYVDRLADDLGRSPLNIKRLIGLNLMLDGMGDFVNGMLGGCAGRAGSDDGGRNRDAAGVRRQAGRARRHDSHGGRRRPRDLSLWRDWAARCGADAIRAGGSLRSAPARDRRDDSHHRHWRQRVCQWLDPGW
jgi:uracil permease